MNSSIFLVILACILVQQANCQSNSIGDQFLDYQIRGRDLANLYRAKHDAPPLKLNTTLNKVAQEFAENLIRTNSFRNKLEPGFIKNLYELKGIEVDNTQAIEGAVKTWYGSEKKFNWRNPDVNAFAALVWKSSTDLGIGIARVGEGGGPGVRTIVVGAFSPEGNLLGEGGKYFRDNVLRSRT